MLTHWLLAYHQRRANAAQTCRYNPSASYIQPPKALGSLCLPMQADGTWHSFPTGFSCWGHLPPGTIHCSFSSTYTWLKFFHANEAYLTKLHI